MTAITFLQDLSRSGDTVDLQKILELKGLKKAEMDKVMDAIETARRQGQQRFNKVLEQMRG